MKYIRYETTQTFQRRWKLTLGSSKQYNCKNDSKNEENYFIGCVTNPFLVRVKYQLSTTQTTKHYDRTIASMLLTTAQTCKSMLDLKGKFMSIGWNGSNTTTNLFVHILFKLLLFKFQFQMFLFIFPRPTTCWMYVRIRNTTRGNRSCCSRRRRWWGRWKPLLHLTNQVALWRPPVKHGSIWRWKIIFR